MMSEAIEIIRQIFENGLTFITLLAVVQILFNWYESQRKRRVCERIEDKQDFMMREMGIEWTGQQRPLHPVLMSLRQWQQLYLAVTSQGVFQLRRGSKMQINKAWLSGVVAYILGQLALKYGFTWNDAWSDTATDIIITFVIPLIVAFMNKTKKPEVPTNNGDAAQRPTDTESAV